MEGNGKLLAIGLTAAAVLIYVSRRGAGATSGVWLDPVVWPEVFYEGPTLPVDEAIASIADYLIAVNYWDSPTETWTQYDGPGGAFNSLAEIVHRNIYHLQVTERCFWSWL